MSKHLLIGFPVVLLMSCADTSDRYRDTHQLEMPPVLPIEHTHAQPALSSDDLKPRAATPLAGLILFEDNDTQPLLTLKTRPDRAWEMVMVALKISNIEIIDKNRAENRIQVRYDPDTGGQEPSFFSALFNNAYAEAEYTINLTEGASGITVHTALSKPDDLEFGDDGSAALVRLLHKTIDEKIIRRDETKTEE